MPSAWQGAWLGIWPGDWFGEEDAAGPSIVNAALVADGTGFASFGAVVEGGVQSGWITGGMAPFQPRPQLRRFVVAALIADGVGSAQMTAAVIAPKYGRTWRRRREEPLYLLAA